MFKAIATSFLFALPLFALGQSGEGEVDSLERVVRTSEQDSLKIFALELLVEHYYARDPDTALKLAKKALSISKEAGKERWIANSYHRMAYPYYVKGDHDKALSYWKKAMRIRKRNGFTKDLIPSYNNIGVIHFNRGNYDSAALYYEKSLKGGKRIGEKKYVVDAHTNLGNVHKERGFYKKAIEHYLKGLRISERSGMKDRTASLCNNIGNIHKDQGNQEKAMEFYERSLEMKRKLGDRRGISNVFTNMGILEEKEGDLKAAKEKYRKSLRIDRELEDKKAIASSYYNLGSLFNTMFARKDSANDAKRELRVTKGITLDSARSYLSRALELQKAIGDRNGIAHSYLGMGKMYLHREAPDKALNAYKKAASITDSLGIRREYYKAHRGVAKAYERSGEYRKALRHFKEFYDVRKEVRARESQEHIEKMAAKYEHEKQQRRIEQQKKEAAIARERNRRHRTIIAFVSGGVLLVGVFALLLYKRLRITRRQKEVIEEQKQVVEEKERQLTDSIQYARKIQNALLQNEERISVRSPEHFTLFIPRTQVSGDFYWTKEHKGYFYIAAVDCTGHGVPGAFMSMLGISQLNEIMNTDEAPTPGEILTELRDRVVRELSGSDPESAAKDGMDAAMVRIPLDEIVGDPLGEGFNPHREEGNKNDHPQGEGFSPRGHADDDADDTVNVQFAGAQNPLYVIRKGVAENGDLTGFGNLSGLGVQDPKHRDLTGLQDPSGLSEHPIQNRLKPFKKSPDGIEIKGDPMQVGYDEHGTGAFSTLTLHLQKGDMLYIFSDGYADQFGGPNGKKFRYASFKQLLASLHERPLEEQKQELQRTFEDWKAESGQEQIDDVVVVGIRL